GWPAPIRRVQAFKASCELDPVQIVSSGGDLAGGCGAQGIGLSNTPTNSHPTRSKEMTCGQIYQPRRYHLSLCQESAWEERILMQPQPLLGQDQQARFLSGRR